MSVIGTAGELPNSPKGNYDKDAFQFERYFIVQCSSYADGPVTAMSAIGLPAYYSSYSTGNESIPMCFAKSFSAERIIPNSLAWKVTVKYSTPDDSVDQHSDPRFDLPEVDISFENYQVPAVESDDIDEAPLINSAAEPFSPVPVMDKARMILTITRNEDISANHPEIGQTFVNTINLDPFWGFLSSQVKCQGVSTKLKQRTLATSQVITYLEVTYTFHCLVGSDTWNLTLLDQGTFYVTGGNKIAFKTKDGIPFVGLLNGSGGDGGGVAHYLDPIQIYNQADFGLFNLPESYAAVVPYPTGE